MPHDGVEGVGELTIISEPVEIIDDDKGIIKSSGSLYVELRITESHPWHPKKISANKISEDRPEPDQYAVGCCIELKKNQIIGRTRKKVV